MKRTAGIARTVSIALAALATTAVTAGAVSEAPSFYTVRNDHGGVIVDYAIKAAQLEQTGQTVKFAGRCDSACTLYLGISEDQLCVTPSARFGFHLPFGSSSQGNRFATTYLLKKYPRWVIGWLRDNGGLNRNLKVMPYEYVSQHIRPCDTQVTDL
ncbi:hypothetical protein [Shinella zoogloeoides]|jgi:hypothetical protein|uniref:Uncharacterized protein n=1 Tax=Shinella zoogloeoides TaxID=352475 RepID=A0A6N8TAH4_SHIZO|nr:hypothetical protein [Shinella zoogloeoides]MXO00227.1 hypothetical protein [Shinella zoogloeoides]UEX82549.1 hypothetical protein K8M09_04515 [Shinella zoogloeoides]